MITLWRRFMRSEPEASFSSEQLAQDMRQLQAILADFFKSVSVADWDRHTERNNSGWTLHQVLAHISVVAEVWHQAVEDTLAGLPVTYAGLTQRSDLPHFNQREIAARQGHAPNTLVESLLSVLEQVANQAAALTAAELELSVPAPAYNRALTVAETMGCQLAHIGIVHGAQLANALAAAPLWSKFSPELMRRQLTYVFHQMSHSYWVERGGDLRASINFYVAGSAGGRWSLTMDPDGGHGGAGWVKRPSLIIWARNANVLCRAFTFQISPLAAILRGQMFGVGKVWLAFRLPYLFRPT